MGVPAYPAVPVATNIVSPKGGARTVRRSWGLHWSQKFSLTLPSAGAGEIDVGPVKGGHQWEIHKIPVWADSPSGANGPCAIYVGPCAAEPWFVDGTATGSGDTWSDGAPMIVPAGDLLILQWTGNYQGGDVLWCRLLYEDVELVPTPI